MICKQPVQSGLKRIVQQERVVGGNVRGLIGGVYDLSGHKDELRWQRDERHHNLTYRRDGAVRGSDAAPSLLHADHVVGQKNRSFLDF